MAYRDEPGSYEANRNVKFRDETLFQLMEGIRGAIRGISSFDADSLQRNCLVCLAFDERSEVCTLYQQRPPARVIAYGCPSFKDVTDIPY